MALSSENGGIAFEGPQREDINGESESPCFSRPCSTNMHSERVNYLGTVDVG